MINTKAVSNQVRNPHNFALDFLKTIATVIIVFHHYQQVTEVYEPVAFFNGRFYWGYLVELFFILSGYFVYRYIPLIQNGKISFKVWYAKRALRLIPLMAVSCVVYEIILYINNNVYHLNYFGLTATAWGTIVASLGFQEGGAFVNPFVNNATWYIGVLMICYGVMYLITNLAKRLNVSPKAFYIAMCLLGVSIITAGFNYPYFNIQAARGYIAFFWGLIISDYVERKGSHKRECILSLIVLALFAFLYWFDFSLINNDMRYILIFLVYPAIIFLFESMAARKIFASKIWGKVGAVQYGVYLWHSPFLLIGFIITNVKGIALDYSNIWYMIVFTIGVELFSIVSYFLIEKPLAKKVNRFIKNMEIAEADAKS